MPKTGVYHGYTAYFVNIVPKKIGRFDIPFVPSNNKTELNVPSNGQIRIIDGASFYDLVTGDANSLSKLFSGLTSRNRQSFRKNNGFGQYHTTNLIYVCILKK
jgi:hypothetical protein